MLLAHLLLHAVQFSANRPSSTRRYSAGTGVTTGLVPFAQSTV